MSICSKCGADVDGAFCPNCGAWMNEPSQPGSQQTVKTFCTQCGAEASGAFCSQCGAPISQGAETSNPYSVGSQTSYNYQANWSGEVPDIPGPLEAFKVCWKKWRQADGRASRSEYWYFCLWQTLILLGIYGLLAGIAAISEAHEGASPLFLLFIPAMLYMVISLLPGINSQIRRLHDSGHSGAWWFICFAPYVGGLILFIFLCLPPTEGPNQYGPQPQKKRP